jgi:hypothetical protein
MVREAGIDYLTVTTRSPDQRGDLERLGRSLVAMEELSGNREREWTYKGYVGQTCGSATWGVREGDALLRCSSGLADDVAGDALRLAGNVARLDLAVTVRYENHNQPSLPDEYRRACVRAKELGGVQCVGAIVNNRSGRTLLLGSRTSSRYGRLYDKEHESKRPEYEGCWRWEVEYKGTAANQVAATARDLPETTPLALSGVHAFFTGRGLAPPWAPDHDVKVPRLRHPTTDAERQLLWLQHQVRPVVQRLVPIFTVEGLSAVLGLTELPLSSE